jgi:hypothetical protein
MAAPGAVSGKSDCATKCSGEAKAAPGAVSGKSGCATKCPSTCGK